MKKKDINIVNRKARFDYHIEQTFIAGIQLMGTEVKSIREAKVNMQDAFCYFEKENILKIRNLHISLFKEGSYNNHEPLRERQLLLNKNELRKLWSKGTEKGLTIVLLKIFENDRGIIKLEIASASGKKQYDKRNDLKTKDLKRDLDRYE